MNQDMGASPLATGLGGSEGPEPDKPSPPVGAIPSAMPRRDIFSPQEIAAAQAETERLTRELDITNADHIALWLEANKDSAPLGWLACRIVEAHEAVLANPPRHKFWGAGEPDCPRDIKAGNGELHTLRCKVCGEDSSANGICRGRRAT